MAQQKASFKKWWKNITGNKAAKGLFNVDLVDSIVYAGVPVHKTVNGRLRIQGYIPTIVSKCGWYLKENGLKTRGIFRVSGSAKRIADLQTLFDAPPLYGSQLDWSPYTIHDASSILRRYLNSLPDPVITLEYYEKFRDVHRTIMDDKEKIVAYQDLMAKLPPPHSCLLMYLLDFLAMFSYHNDENLMTSKNLASVFQPGILSHPDHAMSPGDYMTSASVVEFLIDHQSCFALPTPNFDEEDDEGTSFGLAHSTSHFTADQALSASGPPKLPVAHAYTHVGDQERIRQPMTGKPMDGMGMSDGPGEETLERSKTTSALRRQLSLHKGNGASLSGQRPTRSKSTSSGSSNQQGQQPHFPSNLLARRRSSRLSKTQSMYSTKSLDLDDIVVVDVDAGTAGNGVAVQDTSLSSLSPKHLSVRKAQTFPRLPQTLDGNEPEDATTGSKRAIPREPSVIFETIDLQFPLPIFPDSTFPPSIITEDAVSKQAVDIPSVTPAYDQPLPSIHPLDNTVKLTGEQSVQGPIATTEPVNHVLMPTPNPQQPEDNSHAPPRALGHVDPPRQNVPSMSVSAYNESVPKVAPVISPPRVARPPHRGDGPIQRTKSTPAGLTKSSGGHSKDGNDSHTSSAHNIFKGWLTGRNKDKSNKENEGSAGSKEDKKQDASEKQRKYRSQDMSSTFSSDDQQHSTTTTLNKRDSGRSGGSGGHPWHGGLLGREPIQESVETGLDESRKPTGVPPPRPKPPPPEGSLMDLLEPHQRPNLGSNHSGATTPNGSRSPSPMSHSRAHQQSPTSSPHSHSPPPSIHHHHHGIHNNSKSRSNSLVGQQHHHVPRLTSHGSSASMSSCASTATAAAAGGELSAQTPPRGTARRGESPVAAGLYQHSNASSGSSPNLSQHDQARMSSHSSDTASLSSSLANAPPTPAKSRDRKPSMHYPSSSTTSSPGANRSRSNSFRTASPSRMQQPHSQSPSGSPRLLPASLPAVPQTPPPPVPLTRAESARATPEGSVGGSHGRGWSPGRPQHPVRRGTAPTIHPHHQHYHHSPLADDGNLSRNRSGSGSGHSMRPLPVTRPKSRERHRDIQREREKEREREEEEFRLARAKSTTDSTPHIVPQPGDPPGFF